jgi:DNA-binding NtrC family response regulator
MRSVLVVDDDPMIKKLVARILADAGYDPSTASSLPEALELARERTFELVISDIVLSDGGDGLDLVEAVRAVQPDIHVLHISGYAQRWSSSGGAAILAKPFSAAQLLERVESLLS